MCRQCNLVSSIGRQITTGSSVALPEVGQHLSCRNSKSQQHGRWKGERETGISIKNNVLLAMKSHGVRYDERHATAKLVDQRNLVLARLLVKPPRVACAVWRMRYKQVKHRRDFLPPCLAISNWRSLALRYPCDELH